MTENQTYDSTPGTEGEDLVLDPVERAIADIALGRAVIVVDDEDRENEGDIVFAAAAATPELMAFTIRYSSGVICAPMTGEELDRLKLPPMTQVNEDRKGTAYTVSVDARDGVDTGISAADRARTVRLLASAGTEPGDLTRPGHVFPLRAVEGGVLVRPGHTEAAVDLARLAGLPPAGAIAEVVNDDGTMARLPELVAFAREHGLAVISIEDLIAYRRRTELHVDRAATTSLPTAHGDFTAVGYRGTIDGVEHLALVAGGLGPDGRLPDGEDVLVRVHSECLTGDVFGSLRCDCGPQLEASLKRVAEAGRGVVLYLRGHEGRGIGLTHKLRAYELQEQGRDTVDANLDLGLPADARDYSIAGQMLADLGVRSLTLLTNNPQKLTALTDHGLKVEGREAVATTPGEHNLRYLRTKRDRMGHDLPGLGS
ncbi:bifunctional 3,4-dihydroxy-2-butanone-4-phosphate synthase/GTP cyclohydrolase II [Streptomyces sp. Y1]|uniref:Riboflavin biosynthesis protein RibBA n=1 Tax=Streptomyces sp. Y1 TaxID=3238634 RepID=A0AB39TSG2_9ACTN